MTSRRFHMILDVSHVMNEAVNTKRGMEDFIKVIAAMTEMTIIHGPVVITGTPENPGMTGFAIIDFSHISIHTFTETDEVCVDIFSCKKFPYKDLYYFVRDALMVQDEDIKRSVVTYNNQPKI